VADFCSACTNAAAWGVISKPFDLAAGASQDILSTPSFSYLFNPISGNSFSWDVIETNPSNIVFDPTGAMSFVVPIIANEADLNGTIIGDGTLGGSLQPEPSTVGLVVVSLLVFTVRYFRRKSQT